MHNITRVLEYYYEQASTVVSSMHMGNFVTATVCIPRKNILWIFGF